jgi:hypothetical protein
MDNLMLVIFGGLPGTGKSTLARRLAGELGAVWLRIDTIEYAIADGDEIAAVGAAGYRVAYAVAEDNLPSVALSLPIRSIPWRLHAALGGLLRSAPAYTRLKSRCAVRTRPSIAVASKHALR